MQKAVGRSLVAMVAASLCFISASHALPAPDAHIGKPLMLVNTAGLKQTTRKSAHLHRNARKSVKNGGKAAGKTVAKTVPDTVANTTPVAANRENPGDQANSATAAPPALPPEVANARAELTPGDAQAKSPSIPNEADKTAGVETAASGVQVAAADQLNDIDRDMGTSDTGTPGLAPSDAATPGMTAHAPASASPEQIVALADSQDTAAQPFFSRSPAGGEASLIGKIFIGIGALLMLASAARMLIA